MSEGENATEKPVSKQSAKEFKRRIIALANEGHSLADISRLLWIRFQVDITRQRVHQILASVNLTISPTTKPSISDLVRPIIHDLVNLRQLGYTRPQICEYVHETLGVTVSVSMMSKILTDAMNHTAPSITAPINGDEK
jgi:hypothetical protein